MASSLTGGVGFVLPLQHPRQALRLVLHQGRREDWSRVGGRLFRQQLRRVRVKLVEHLVQLSLPNFFGEQNKNTKNKKQKTAQRGKQVSDGTTYTSKEARLVVVFESVLFALLLRSMTLKSAWNQGDRGGGRGGGGKQEQLNSPKKATDAKGPHQSKPKRHESYVPVRFYLSPAVSAGRATATATATKITAIAAAAAERVVAQDVSTTTSAGSGEGEAQALG